MNILSFCSTTSGGFCDLSYWNANESTELLRIQGSGPLEAYQGIAIPSNKTIAMANTASTYTGTINSPTLSASRSWTFPDIGGNVGILPSTPTTNHLLSYGPDGGVDDSGLAVSSISALVQKPASTVNGTPLTGTGTKTQQAQFTLPALSTEGEFDLWIYFNGSTGNAGTLTIEIDLNTTALFGSSLSAVANSNAAEHIHCRNTASASQQYCELIYYRTGLNNALTNVNSATVNTGTSQNITVYFTLGTTTDTYTLKSASLTYTQ